jgi:hypothetical protein
MDMQRSNSGNYPRDSVDRPPRSSSIRLGHLYAIYVFFFYGKKRSPACCTVPGLQE